ncbi:hypothetical protein [uncultured Proteiniphilum sp.]|uniref:hypothetical protein n=1 Tax=uncultured Proteiniphilum sp. TaxID=497637 RepID=UPI002620936E|nr:hypothetical protein [uncultured Proteiniphilum sp.]
MTTDIRRLLDNYFEGNTSAEEEKTLRRYFAQDDLPEDMQVVAPIFRFLDDESAAMAVLNEIQRESPITTRRKPLLLRKLRTIAAVAAALLIAVVLLTRPDKPFPSLNGNYVWVNGKRITDPATVRKYAESSFGKVRSESDIIEDQLRFILE